jgi:hypothetical protein
MADFVMKITYPLDGYIHSLSEDTCFITAAKHRRSDEVQHKLGMIPKMGNTGELCKPRLHPIPTI